MDLVAELGTVACHARDAGYRRARTAACIRASRVALRIAGGHSPSTEQISRHSK
jgi:hypothetical protein